MQRQGVEGQILEEGGEAPDSRDGVGKDESATLGVEKKGGVQVEVLTKSVYMSIERKSPE